MNQENNLLENDLIIDSATASHLKEILMWSKLLAIIGFIMSGLIAVIAFVVVAFFSKLTHSNGDIGTFAGGSVMAVYLAIAVVAFFMARFLFLFAKKAQVALSTSDQENLIEAFKNLKIYFRFAGVITIISLVFVVLGAIGVVMAASISR